MCYAVIPALYNNIMFGSSKQRQQKDYSTDRCRRWVLRWGRDVPASSQASWASHAPAARHLHVIARCATAKPTSRPYAICAWARRSTYTLLEVTASHVHCESGNISQKQVCVQPRTSTVNVTLPAFAAERHAAAPLQPVRGDGARCCRSISPAHRALSSKLTSHRCRRSTGQADRPTDARPFS